jgi:hypothetical protein
MGLVAYLADERGEEAGDLGGSERVEHIIEHHLGQQQLLTRIHLTRHTA